jgi:hypothetical protein
MVTLAGLAIELAAIPIRRVPVLCDSGHRFGNRRRDDGKKREKDGEANYW